MQLVKVRQQIAQLVQTLTISNGLLEVQEAKEPNVLHHAMPDHMPMTLIEHVMSVSHTASHVTGPPLMSVLHVKPILPIILKEQVA